MRSRQVAQSRVWLAAFDPESAEDPVRAVVDALREEALVAEVPGG